MIAFIREKSSGPHLKKVEEPRIQSPDEVKIKISYSTLCRDDMDIYDEFNMFGYGIMGHEAAGIIVEAGANAQMHGFYPGCRVTLIPFNSCGTCRHCISQNPQNCSEAHLLGGVLCEFVVRSFRNLILLPDWLSLKQASLLEPVADILTALEKVTIDFSNDILIIGSGFLGLTAIQILHMMGVKKIVVVEPLEERRKLALKHGATLAYDSQAPNLQLTLLKATDFQGFDLAIDTSARADIFDFALPCLTHGGTILLLAYKNVQSKISVPILHVYSQNMKLIWSALCNIKSLHSAMHLIQRLTLDGLITAEYPFENAWQAYHRYLGTEEIKIGIRFP